MKNKTDLALLSALDNHHVSGLVASIRGGATVSIPSSEAQAFFIFLFSGALGGSLGVVVNNPHEGFSRLKAAFGSFFTDRYVFFPSLVDPVHAVPGFRPRVRVEFERSFSLLSRDPSLVGVCHAPSLSVRVSDPDSLKKEGIGLRAGENTSRGSLVRLLSGWGYAQTDNCYAPNTYSIRGGIVDFFPCSGNWPLRLEFFSDRLESIRQYNPETQCSESVLGSFFLFPPAVLKKKKRAVLFEKIFEKSFKNILYITDDLVSLGQPTKNQVNVFVEKLDVSKMTKEASSSLFKRAVSAGGSVFLFNPKKKPHSLGAGFIEIDRPLPFGFKVQAYGLYCFLLSGKSANHKAKPFFALQTSRLSELKEIEWGNFLVHEDYGVGVYRGLSLVGKAGAEEENIKIEYSGGSTVHVPVNRFGRVHKYIGGGSSPKIATLGSGLWEKQKQITKKTAESVVDYLIEAYRSRSNSRGFKYSGEPELEGKLATSFKHEETVDQLSAVRDVFKDMAKKTPMDRLLYGDVGFGKTEVAIRAAMRAVVSGRVVFFLSPTTILSDQHFIVCKNRLSPLGVHVELLSRFRSPKQQKEIIENLHQSRVDVLVGTHRLLSPDVPTGRLGLLIVDEEHRFGVKHKETIRRLKKRVDTLTLTATPIPRTLQQSLIGIRDTSRIDVPPEGRLPVETFVSFFDWKHVLDIIQKETSRGGQVYFLHNKTAGLESFCQKIKAGIPHLNVSYAHGKMSSKSLEKTILSFFDGGVDVLVCTTIIESGLDVPKANTIIINNAQDFGLAQLYQIRGRVGRGDVQAYCYLCVPKKGGLSSEAFQRLSAIEHYSALGSAYSIATKDLEIRGAGNLFGHEQSGQISRVGLEMFNKILSSAVRRRRNPRKNQENNKELPSVVFSGVAYFGKQRMPLVRDRIYFYEQLSRARTVDQLKKIKDEVVDRFGRLSLKEENLFAITEIQCRLYPHPFSKCVITNSKISFFLSGLPQGLDGSSFFEQMSRVLSKTTPPHKINSAHDEQLQLSFSIKSEQEGLAFGKKFDRLFSVIISG